MKKVILVSTLLSVISFYSFSQVIKIGNGIDISSMENSKFNLLPNKRTGYVGTIGLDYFEHKYFYLSSEIGYLQKGGKDAIFFTDQSGQPLSESKVDIRLDYLHINTTFRGRYAINNSNTVYVGIGPKIDIPVNSKISSNNDHFIALFQEDTPLDYRVKNLKTSFGLLPEIGFTYDMNKFRFDINAAYLVNFGRIDKNPINDELGNKVYNNTFLFRFNVGYKLN